MLMESIKIGLENLVCGLYVIKRMLIYNTQIIREKGNSPNIPSLKYSAKSNIRKKGYFLYLIIALLFIE